MSNSFNSKVKRVIEKIKDSKKVALISHIQPDGDSIGSLLGFGLGLKKEYNNIDFIASDKIAKQFKFLPGIDLLSEKNIEDYDLIITLDCSDLGRIGEYKEIIEKKDTFIINIDHHVSNTSYGDINIVNPDASSTGEIIYEILNILNMDIDKDIATCLYVSISTDTGSFKYDSTTSRTHIVISDLLDQGVNINDVTVNLYQNRSLQKTKLFILAIETLELLNDNKFAIVKVTQEMLKRTDTTIKDIDGLVEFARDIDTVEVACVLKELKDNEIKIGLRSKEYIDVSEIAVKFNGGGHKKASGCTIEDNIDKAKQMIIDEIQKHLG
ncbi:MAG: bifunctional oligoribonuclease/PAP phosphatase NrnA [Firmicutes bacterium]|nr:bifunctional oligoribonuclease/PAP phosphatase NrnA [Bacillota bacterium]